MTDAPKPVPPEPIVIRDKRKIDPVTGKARAEQPAVRRQGGPLGTDPADAPVPDTSSDKPRDEAHNDGARDDEVTALHAQLAERTADLQRVQAEYANYRKRAERDRLAAADLGVARALGELLPVLDDIERADEHGDLSGGLKAIADKLTQALDKLGLTAFGELGDPFDPTVHEAVTHGESEDVDRPTCTMIMRKGYKHGGRLLRPAMVGVSDPAAPAVEPTGAAGATGPAGAAGAAGATEDPAAPAGEPAAAAEGAAPGDGARDSEASR